MLRRKSIKFYEIHNSKDYILKFPVKFNDSCCKLYEFTIELGSSRIIYMTIMKSPNDTKLMEINNSEGIVYLL